MLIIIIIKFFLLIILNIFSEFYNFDPKIF